jgi:phosphate:Na+ symporter
LRRTLQRLVGGHFSAIVSGVLFTAAIQSSTAASLTVIGFVSAGLVTLPQAIGVIVGATLGTTTTPWMVAFFGFGVSISSVALPMLGIGAFFWLIGKGRLRSSGAILAGFGLIFTGIEYLQAGMEGVSWNLERIAGTGSGAKWILAGIGVAMTVVMQSSSAAAAATLVALYAGSLTFEQGCAMLVGQSVGSAATTALVVIGGSLAVRRTALAHILYTVIVGVLVMLLLGPLTTAASWVGARLDDPDGVLALAAFSSIFKLAGIVAFYPWLDAFARFIVRISGGGRDSAVSRLDPTIVEAGAAVALEAAWRAVLEIARDAVDAVRGRLAGETVKYDPPLEAAQQIERFLESLPLETIDLGTIAPRLVRLCHALDHLAQLHDDLGRPLSVASDWRPPAGFAAGVQALAAWLDATKDPGANVDPAVHQALEAASKQLGAEREAGREQLLQDVALQRIATAPARAGLDVLAWADGALYHTWRLAESLEIASSEGTQSTPQS